VINMINSKKAIEFQTIATVIIVVAVLVIIFLIFFPMITKGGEDIRGLSPEKATLSSAECSLKCQVAKQLPTLNNAKTSYCCSDGKVNNCEEVYACEYDGEAISCQGVICQTTDNS